MREKISDSDDPGACLWGLPVFISMIYLNYQKREHFLFISTICFTNNILFCQKNHILTLNNYFESY